MVALRTDIDALPIHEESDVPFRLDTMSSSTDHNNCTHHRSVAAWPITFTNISTHHHMSSVPAPLSMHRSKIDGKSHACGHDSHMTMLLGGAKMLKKRESELKGSVKLFFQPAEEGGAGGERMVKEGLHEFTTSVKTAWSSVSLFTLRFMFPYVAILSCLSMGCCQPHVHGNSSM